MAITLEEAKALKFGTVLYLACYCGVDGTPQRWRVNGKPKTWKTRPNEVQVPLKFGLYGFGYLTQNELQDFCLSSEEALIRWDKIYQALELDDSLKGSPFLTSRFCYCLPSLPKNISYSQSKGYEVFVCWENLSGYHVVSEAVNQKVWLDMTKKEAEEEVDNMNHHLLRLSLRDIQDIRQSALCNNRKSSKK